MRSLRTGKEFYPALTGVRAIAAYLVYLYHFNPFVGHDTNQVSKLLLQVCGEFHTGVTIFFVLSGFLITLRYYDNVHITRKWFAEYIRNRIARIYPMLFLITCFTFLMIAFYPKYDFEGSYANQSLSYKIAAFVTSITLTKGFFETLGLIVIVQAWSLTVEECFYLSAPFLFIGIKRNPRKKFIYPVFILLTGGLLVFAGKYFQYYGFFGSMKFMLSYTFFGRCIEFFCGIALALFIKKQEVGKAIKGLPVFTFTGMFAMAVTILLMAYVTNYVFTDAKNYISIFLNNVILPVGIVCFFYGLIMEKSFFKKALESKLMVLLGKSSYIFYLIHMGVFKMLISEHVSDNFLAKFILLNVLSVFMFTFIEKPLNSKIRKSLTFKAHS